MTFGERLKILRKQKKLTQSELAKILHLEQATISAYENNKIIPTSDTIEKVATFFNVSADYLLDISHENQNEIIKNINNTLIEHPEIAEDLYTILQTLTRQQK